MKVWLCAWMLSLVVLGVQPAQGNGLKAVKGKMGDTMARWLAKIGRPLTALSLQAKSLSNHTKQMGTDEYIGGEDHSGRADLVQAIPLHVSPIQALLYAEGGGAEFYHNERQAQVSGGIGFQGSRVLFGKEMRLQVRSGIGYLGEGKYEEGEYVGTER